MLAFVSDQVQIAAIGIVGLAITSLPALIVAMGNRRHLMDAKDVAVVAATKADAVEKRLGDPNGHIDMTTMLERIMEAQGAMLQWQNQHGADDMEQLRLLKLRLDVVEQLLDARTPLFTVLQHELEELVAYSHARNHDILNILTGVKGRVDLMWGGSEFDDLKDPAKMGGEESKAKIADEPATRN